MDSRIRTPIQLASALKTRRKELALAQVETASRVGLLPKTISALGSSPERCSLESLPAAISEASSGLPPDFPDSVAGPIFEGLRAAGERME